MKEKNYVLLISLIFFLFEVIIGSRIFIWLDEGFTLNTTTESIQESVRRSIIFEGQPPLYFLLLTIWRKLNTSIFFARLFSILCATASIPLFYNYLKLTRSKLNPIITTVFFALNPTLIWAGLEIRVYAMILLCSLLLFIYFHKFYISDKITIKKRLFFILLSVISIHTQYYLAIILFLNFIFLHFTNRKVAFIYLIDMIIPVISLIPYFLFIPDQIAFMTVNKIYGISDYIMYWFRFIRYFILPIPKVFQSNTLNLVLFLMFFVLIVGSVYPKFKSLIKNMLSIEKYSIILVSITIVVIHFLMFKLGMATASPRHFIFLLTPFIILFFTVIYNITNKNLKALFVTLLILFNFGNIVSKAPDFGKDEDLIGISKYINSNNKRYNPILFYTGDIKILYEFTNNHTKLYSIPNEIDLSVQYDHPSWFIKNEDELTLFFDKLDSINTFWIIDNEVNPLTEELLEKRFQCKVNFELLDKYISDNFNVIESKTFNDLYRLRKITRK